MAACELNPAAEMFSSILKYFDQFLVFKNENVSHENLDFIKILGAGNPGLAFLRSNKQLKRHRTCPFQRGLVTSLY